MTYHSNIAAMKHQMPDDSQHTSSQDRWLVSYADFITLLFAFFVVMYSISSVNDGKYRVLSESMVTAFKITPRAMEPVQVGRPMVPKREVEKRLDQPLIVPIPGLPLPASRSPHEVPAPELVQPIQTDPAQTDPAQSNPEQIDPAQVQTPAQQRLGRLHHEVALAMQELIDQDLLRAHLYADRLELEINAQVLFASGSAHLSEQARPVLKQIAALLQAMDNQIHVQGYTDNVPIQNEIYPSNWELSAARAASVVHLLTEQGLQPQRLVAIGFGEHRPVADNATAQGRQQNRRVVLVIPAQVEDAAGLLP